MRQPATEGEPATQGRRAINAGFPHCSQIQTPSALAQGPVTFMNTNLVSIDANAKNANRHTHACAHAPTHQEDTQRLLSTPAHSSGMRAQITSHDAPQDYDARLGIRPACSGNERFKLLGVVHPCPNGLYPTNERASGTTELSQLAPTCPNNCVPHAHTEVTACVVQGKSVATTTCWDILGHLSCLSTPFTNRTLSFRAESCPTHHSPTHSALAWPFRESPGPHVLRVAPPRHSRHRIVDLSDERLRHNERARMVRLSRQSRAEGRPCHKVCRQTPASGVRCYLCISEAGAVSGAPTVRALYAAGVRKPIETYRILLLERLDHDARGGSGQSVDAD